MLNSNDFNCVNVFFLMTEQQRAELVQNIIQVCNCNADTAQKLLSYCNWDVLAAINLHFTGFDINKIPQSNAPAAATLVQSLNHDLYINFQEEAKKLNKWAIVYIKMSKKDVCIFDRFSMYDYVGTNFLLNQKIHVQSGLLIISTLQYRLL